MVPPTSPGLSGRGCTRASSRCCCTGRTRAPPTGTVQSLRHVRLCDLVNPSTPGLPVQPTPRVYSNPRPSSRWCHPAISSSVIPFSSCPPIPPSIRVFSNVSALRMRWPNYSSQAPLLSSSSPVSIVSGAWSGWERLRDAPPRAGRAVFPCQPTVLCVSSGEDPAHFLLFFSLFQESPYCSP